MTQPWCQIDSLSTKNIPSRNAKVECGAGGETTNKAGKVCKDALSSMLVYANATLNFLNSTIPFHQQRVRYASVLIFVHNLIQHKASWLLQDLWFLDVLSPFNHYVTMCLSLSSRKHQQKGPSKTSWTTPGPTNTNQRRGKLFDPICWASHDWRHSGGAFMAGRALRRARSDQNAHNKSFSDVNMTHS